MRRTRRLKILVSVHVVIELSRLTNCRTDDPELYHGSPVAIQLVGRRLQEEKMIALAKYIGEALHGTARAL